MKTKFLLLFFLIASLSLRGQAEYWQQEVNYKIRVKLNDSLHTLTGFIEMEYINHSPDTLDFIYMHLWANAFSSDYTAYAKQKTMFLSSDFYFSKQAQKGYINQLDFSVDDVPSRLIFDNQHPDIAKLVLPNSILPREKRVLKSPFFLKIPHAFSRLGHIGQSYYITQWYPKPAVYDSEGWHPMPYMDIGEFYSEFGSFWVEITLPEEYMVAATGQLTTPSEIERVNQRIEDSKRDTLIFLNTKSGELKTIQYFQKDIHDFAWFADKDFLIDKSAVKLPLTEEFIDTYTFYHAKNREKWSKAIEYVNHAIWFFSDEIGPYPYPHCTAVEGLPGVGGGMEYPMITLIGDGGSDIGLERVIIHEIAHNWFYGIFGFNERKYPWLDEGFTSFYENEYINWKYPHHNLVNSQMNLPEKFNLKIFNIHKLKPDYLPYIAVQYLQSRNIDSKMISVSDEMSLDNYFIQSYLKPIPLFKSFQQSINKYTFKVIMNDFYSDWKFTHPSPQIVQNHFEMESNQNLSWLFQDIIENNRKVDYKVVNLKKDKLNPSKEVFSKASLKIKNRTGTAAPFSISILDSQNNELSKKWHIGFQGKQTFELNLDDSARKIVVNHGFTDIETNKTNNSIRTSGIFKKVDLPKFHFVYSASKLDYTPIFVMPTLGYNKYNSWMPGVLLYSDPIILRNLDYVINPMWSFKTNTWVGNADMGYLLKPHNTSVASIKIGAEARRYNYLFVGEKREYSRISPKIEINFKDIVSRNIQTRMEIRHYFVNQGVYLIYPIGNGQRTTIDQVNYQLTRIHLDFNKKHKVRPRKLAFDLQFSNDLYKASLEYNYTYFYAKKSTFEYRIFGGQIFNYNPYNTPNYQFRADGLSTSYVGSNDYLFDHTFIGRSETSGLWAHQMYIHEGGFKMSTPLGVSNWIIALNASIAIPKVPIIRIFADIATYDKAKSQLNNEGVFIYEAGFQLRFVKDIFEVYVPLLISKDLQRVSDLNNRKFQDRIRFVLNLEALNPYKYKTHYHKILM
ncbi:MAG: M1 family metallopeptidase [Bacteroidales bacterium]|nr:M1 family metallopeptidase [Bacteroidales bacterium]